jgi:hypothetical protein
MAMVLKIINVLFCDAAVHPIGTRFTGYVDGVQRHKLLKFERDRQAGGETAKVGNLTSL